LQKIIKNILSNPNGTIFNRRQYIAYAGNVLILGRSVRATEEVVPKLTKATLSKTKYVKIKTYNKFRARSANRWTGI
jgi:hypothetical protein